MKIKEKGTTTDNLKSSKLSKDKAKGLAYLKIDNLNKKVALFRKNEERLKVKSDLQIQ